FEVARHYFLAVGEYEQFLLSARDDEEAVFVDAAEVAGMQPAIADRLGGRLSIIPVTYHDVRPARQHFAIGGDCHFDAGQGRPYRPGFFEIPAMKKKARRVSVRPVPRKTQDARRVIRFRHGQRQRSTTRAQPLQARAEDVAKLTAGLGWIMRCD